MGVVGSAQRGAGQGQGSLFDLMSSRRTAQASSFCRDIPEVDSREKLAWEKELVGVYLSEHPLQRAALKLAGTVTALCGEIDADMDKQKVVVAGMITNLRRITTKKGDPMVFVDAGGCAGQHRGHRLPARVQADGRPVGDGSESWWYAARSMCANEKVSIICDEAQIYAEDMTAQDHPEEIDASLIWSGPPPSDVDADVDDEEAQPQAGARRNSGGKGSQPPRKVADGNGHGAYKTKPVSEPRHFLRISVPYPDEDTGMNRLREVHQTLARYPGTDRVSLWLQSSLARYKLSTSVTTRYCTGLASDLAAILGDGAVNVDQL